MQDTPTPAELLGAVARQLREVFGPALATHGEPAMAYQSRVAANMLDIVARQIDLSPAADQAELHRLHGLLAEVDPSASLAVAAPAGDAGVQEPAARLKALNRVLADALAEGRLDLHSPGVAEHLWRTALDKLAVDQPRYGSYRRALSAGDPPSPR